MSSIQIENINDGTLCTFSDGATVWFDSRTDAALFGQQLMMVASLGGNALDEERVE